ncbi:MAG: prepilin peptidase [Lachnospiraceae bacterium]|nr:prepilin peptidase [Lachnospiraceae bacterium]
MFAVLIACLLTTSVTADLMTDKIPNALTLTGLTAGMLIALERAGPSGLIGVMKDVVLMFLVTFLLFRLRALRGGDGKLLCALAALLGLQTAATILLYSLFLAVMIGAGKILRETKQKRKRKGPTGIHYSIPILCSVIIYGVRYWM